MIMFRILIEVHRIKEVLSTVFKINKNIYKYIFFFFLRIHITLNVSFFIILITSV